MVVCAFYVCLVCVCIYMLCVFMFMPVYVYCVVCVHEQAIFAQYTCTGVELIGYGFSHSLQGCLWFCIECCQVDQKHCLKRFPFKNLAIG